MCALCCFLTTCIRPTGFLSLFTAVTGIRLVKGPNHNAGRLEVRIGGWWGTVCSASDGFAGFDDKAAKAACKQLGKSGGMAHCYAFYGRGSSEMGVLM